MKVVILIQYVGTEAGLEWYWFVTSHIGHFCLELSKNDFIQLHYFFYINWFQVIYNLKNYLLWLKKKVITIFWQNLKILDIVLSCCCKVLSHYGSKGWLCLFKNTLKMSLFRQKTDGAPIVWQTRCSVFLCDFHSEKWSKWCVNRIQKAFCWNC